ncbi:MAG TPA: nucleotide sugar dehydrogenase, partial [Bacteroidales bacterium]|nr:nucleotide sugar dehydrogenase [Bacteroidales bacterium]
SRERIFADMVELLKMRGYNGKLDPSESLKRLVVHHDPYQAADQAHAILVITEWDEFKEYNWSRIYSQMLKPAFLFDGRNILDATSLKGLGFEVYQIGK